MPLVRNMLITIAIFFAVIFAISLFLPSKWEVKRSTIIQADAKSVFPYINDLHKWSEWYPWTRNMDVSMVSIYEGPETGGGSIKRWNGSEIKNGEIKIVKSISNEGVWYTFKTDLSEMIVHGSLIIKTDKSGENSNSVEITWIDGGDIGRSILARFSAGGLDTAIGGKFEEGLKNLKKAVEESRSVNRLEKFSDQK